MASTILDPTHASDPGHRMSAWRRNRAYFAGLAPATALLALFFVFPAGWALYSSFTNEALIGRDAQNPSWIGLDNYRRLFDDPDFVEVLRNSLVFVFGSAIVGQFAVGLGVALLIDHAESRRYKLTNLAYGAVLLAWVNPAGQSHLNFARPLTGLCGVIRSSNWVITSLVRVENLGKSGSRRWLVSR